MGQSFGAWPEEHRGLGGPVWLPSSDPQSWRNQRADRKGWDSRICKAGGFLPCPQDRQCAKEGVRMGQCLAGLGHVWTPPHRLAGSSVDSQTLGTGVPLGTGISRSSVEGHAGAAAHWARRESQRDPPGGGSGGRRRSQPSPSPDLRVPGSG